MGSARNCILSLIFISLVLFIFNSHLISTSYKPKFISDVSSNRILSRFRSLLSLQTRNFTTNMTHHHFTALSPSPAPSQAVRKPLSTTPFRVKNGAPTKPPPHHAHNITDTSSSHDKHGRGKIVVIAISVSLVLTMVICLAIFLLCKRPHDNEKSNGNNKKVSFDPGPELFYQNSLAHFVDRHDSNHIKMPTETIQMHRNTVSSPCHSENEEVIVRCEGDNCSDEETLSFHSAWASELSELPQYQIQLPSNSPSNSSLKSMSPMHRTNYKTIRFVPPPFTQDEDNDAPQNMHMAASNYPCEMRIPSISHPKISFLSSKNSQFCSKNAFNSHDHNSQSDVLTTNFPDMLHDNCSYLKPSFVGKSMHIPSDTDPNSEILSCSQEVQSKKGISPFKFPLASDNVSDILNFPEPKHAPTNSTHMDLPAISSPRVSFISGTKIKNSKTNSISNSPDAQSANGRHSNNVHIPKTSPPPPPPPPPPMRPRKNTILQRPCNDGRFLPSPNLMKQLEQSGNDKSTLPKLKPLHWDKVRAAPDQSMVWDNIKSSSFEFDEKMMESLFGYNSRSAVNKEEVKSKSPSPSKHVLEHKRLQNITILLKALNATTHQICHAITIGSGLSVQQLEALVKMAPTKEEEENLVKYQDDVEELDPAEKFVKEVLRIPFSFAKMEVMLYKETFQDEVSHLRCSFSMLEEACKELKSSKLFLRLLEAVLKTGNRMNMGTTRGGARAFKLDTLLKLADVKGTDGRTTLLHFVVQEMNKPKPGEEKVDKEITGLDLVSGLSTELSNVKKTASIDLDVLIGSVQNLSLGLCKLKQLVQSELCVDESNLTFVQSMKAFVQNAEEVIEELKNEEHEVLIHVKEITEYYHGNLSKEETNPLRIFVIVRDFLGMLDRVCKELRQPKMHSGGPQLVMFNR